MDATDGPAPNEPLPSPRALRARLPATPRARALAGWTRAAIRDLLRGRDPRLLALVGPCSLHDPAAALEYAARLRKVAAETADVLLVAMRTYVEKPRTRVGWAGLAKDPALDGSGDLGAGLALSRSLLAEIGDSGVPCAGELLDPLVAPYLVDLLAWAAIGARTAESPIHRELASALDLPVGFKNGTDGRVDVAAHAVAAARRPQVRLALGDDGAARVVHTRGNPDVHLVLRGGARGPNYDAASVADAAARVEAPALARPVLVDCSHDNSGKDPARQPEVLRALLAQIAAGSAPILGFMLESHLRGGRQDVRAGAPLAYGVSITDACLGFEETERLLFSAAEALRTLRGNRVGGPE
jgi:3-deoxy-7-phosphoheptulonate synthase